MEEDSFNFQEGLQGALNPINNMTSILNDNEVDLQHTENFIAYKNKEIRKLQSNIDIFDLTSSAIERRSKLVDSTLNELDYSLDISHKCSEEKISLQILLQEKIDDYKEKIKQAEIGFKKQYNDYVQEYNNILLTYERYHPLFKQFKKVKIESLKLEVDLKIINKSISNLIEQKATHKEIQKKIMQTNIIKFVTAVLELKKCEKLQVELKKAQNYEEELVKKLELLELKEKEMVTSVLRTPAEIPNLEFHHSRIIEDVPMRNINSAPKVSFAMDNSKFNFESWMSGINSRCNQRHQLWLQNRSILNEKLPQKRPAAAENKNETRPPPYKQIKMQPAIIKTLQNVLVCKGVKSNEQFKPQQTVADVIEPQLQVVEKNDSAIPTTTIEYKASEPKASTYFTKKSFDVIISPKKKTECNAAENKQIMDTSSPDHTISSFNNSPFQLNSQKQREQEESSYTNDDLQSEDLGDFPFNISPTESLDENLTENNAFQLNKPEPENPFTFFGISRPSGNDKGSMFSNFF